MSLFTKIFSRKALFSRYGFASSIGIISLVTASLSGLIYVETQKVFELSLENYKRDAHHKTTAVQEKIESTFGSIYQSLRTISRLPSVKEIDRHADNLSDNGRVVIQEIYNNLTNTVAVSAVYIVPVDFNPNIVDPLTKKLEKPVISFDGLAAKATGNNDISTTEAAEIYEYQLMQEQISWFKEHYPTADEIYWKYVPAISGREVMTHDSARYAPTDKDSPNHSGGVYSVPFYDSNGQLKGIVSAVILSDVLRAILPQSDYALINSNHKQRILAFSPSETLIESGKWIDKDMENPNLIYSETIPLDIIDGGGRWKIWVGLPDNNFYDDIRNTEILQFQKIDCASILFLGLLTILGLIVFRRNSLQMAKDLILAKENAEAESIKKSQFLSNIINNAVDGLITINEIGIIQSFNPAAEKIFGYPSSEIIGQNVNILMPEPDHSQHDRYLSDYSRTGKAKILGVGREVKGKRKDGEVFLLELAVSLITLDDGSHLFSGIVRDITERKMVEDKLKETQDRFQLAIIGSNNGIWDWNIQTGEAYFSPQFKKMLGFEEHEIGNSFSEWSSRLHPDEKEQVLELLQKHLQERKAPYDVEYHMQVKSGEYKWFRTKGQAVWDEQGNPMRMAGSFSDISKRKDVEQQLKDYAKKMEEANSQLDLLQKEAEEMNIELIFANEQAQLERMKADEATKLKSEFLANMSHEIRTPMNGIIGMTNLLLECDLKPAEKNYLKIIINSAESLLQIINDILDFSKIEAGKIDLEKIPFDLYSVCRDVCEMMAVKANEKGIELLLNYQQGAPRFCIGDPVRVKQILFNLVNNAIKFTNNGHVLLSLQAKEVDNKLKFHIEVKDTGIGIPADKILLIFNKFSQADQSTARKFGGTGLGLSICKELTRMMDGDIGVRSIYGVGSTFWFDIMLEEDKIAANAKTAPLEHSFNDQQQINSEELKFNDVQVLLAEDNPINQTVAISILEKYGCHVTTASHVDEAGQKIKQRNFDLVLMDCQMPVIDGYEATQIIRKLETHNKLPHVPIIAFTANAMKGDDEKCLQAGMDDYIPKPVRKSDLERILTEWLPQEKRISNTTQKIKVLNSDAKMNNITDINMEVFNSFKDLLGDKLEDTLLTHFEVAENYVAVITDSLSSKNFAAIKGAAHPLKSSSQQIGAMKVAAIAKEIERAASSAKPDIKTLKKLAKQVQKAQQEAANIITLHLKGKAI